MIEREDNDRFLFYFATESESDENENDNASNNRFNLRDKMLESGNFDLQTCIDYYQ